MSRRRRFENSRLRKVAKDLQERGPERWTGKAQTWPCGLELRRSSWLERMPTRFTVEDGEEVYTSMAKIMLGEQSQRSGFSFLEEERTEN